MNGNNISKKSIINILNQFAISKANPKIYLFCIFKNAEEFKSNYDDTKDFEAR